MYHIRSTDEAPTGGDAAAAVAWLADSKVLFPLPSEYGTYKPDSGLGFQVKVLNLFKSFPPGDMADDLGR